MRARVQQSRAGQTAAARTSSSLASYLVAYGVASSFGRSDSSLAAASSARNASIDRSVSVLYSSSQLAFRSIWMAPPSRSSRRASMAIEQEMTGRAAGAIMQSNGLRLTNFHIGVARTRTRSRWRRRRRRPTFASPVRAPPARTTHPSRLPVSPPAQPPTACVLFGGRARRGSSASTRRRTPGRRPALCAVRVRPLNAREKAGDADCAWKIKKNHITSTGGDRDVSLHFGEPAATPLPLNSHHSAP